jgi:hypothetical protein
MGNYKHKNPNPFFLLAKFIIKNSKKKWFWRFSVARSEKIKNRQIQIFGFYCVAKNLKWFNLHLCSQKWFLIDSQNLAKIYLGMMIATLATNKNSFKKTHSAAAQSSTYGWFLDVVFIVSQKNRDEWLKISTSYFWSIARFG